jgi:hypothetical protein
MYDWFYLPTNFIDDPEALLKRNKAKLKRVSALELEDNCIRQNLTLEFEVMANKSLREFSTPTTANIHTGSKVKVGENGFELKPTLINMVQASQFCRKAYEDASAHLQHFLEICSTFTIKGVTKDAILLCLFHSHYWERLRSSSTPTKTRLLHGRSSPQPS